MGLKKITENVEIHQTLPDNPTLTSEQLKAEWDKGCKIIKDAFNNLISNFTTPQLVLLNEWWSNGLSSIFAIERRVFLQLSIRNTTNTEKVIMILPELYRPSDIVMFIFNINTAATKTFRGTISTNGEVKVHDPITSAEMKEGIIGFISYIAK